MMMMMMMRSAFDKKKKSGKRTHIFSLRRLVFRLSDTTTERIINGPVLQVVVAPVVWWPQNELDWHAVNMTDGLAKLPGAHCVPTFGGWKQRLMEHASTTCAGLLASIPSRCS